MEVLICLAWILLLMQWWKSLRGRNYSWPWMFLLKSMDVLILTAFFLSFLVFDGRQELPGPPSTLHWSSESSHIIDSHHHHHSDPTWRDFQLDPVGIILKQKLHPEASQQASPASPATRACWASHLHPHSCREENAEHEIPITLLVSLPSFLCGVLGKADRKQPEFLFCLQKIFFF